jgi:MerR family transcriptional regulator, light-induced transcriptional regulator
MNIKEEDKLFSIQMVSQLTGLSAHTIRAWEKRYQALTPMRSDTGRRLYNAPEVERLTLLAQLTNFGSSISQIARLSDLDLKELYGKLISNKTPFLPQQFLAPKRAFNIDQAKKDLIEALAQYKVDVVSQLLSEAKLSTSPLEFAMEIFQPLLQEVQALVTKGVFKHAQVQALYALAKFHAGTIIYSHYEKSLKSKSRVVLTSIENDHSSQELILSTLIACHHGLDFFYLNSSLPAPSIVEAVKATESSVLVLSISQERCQSSDVATVLDEIMSALPSKTEAWIIGSANDPKLKFERWKNCRRLNQLGELNQLFGSLS